MRIIAGRWRGRTLAAPAGLATRPTADRVRQALFDALWHAPWGGRDLIEGAEVLDAFAGTGALGLEALSRGAARAHFLENGREALPVLRANIAACGASARVLAADATRPPRAERPCGLWFLDPPYGKALAEAALPALRRAGWAGPDTVACVELGRGEGLEAPGWDRLDERAHGAARTLVLRVRAD